MSEQWEAVEAAAEKLRGAYDAAGRARDAARAAERTAQEAMFKLEHATYDYEEAMRLFAPQYSPTKG